MQKRRISGRRLFDEKNDPDFADEQLRPKQIDNYLKAELKL
jgi:hypothetical protein